MKFMIGTKGRMTQVFDEKGVVTAATLVTAIPLAVTQIKSKDKDGYEAVQVGYGLTKESRVNKAQLGHGKGQAFRHFKEFELSGTPAEVGTAIDVSVFVPGDVVTVSAVSKGKGFQGVVKRHGFAGGPRSHGQKNKERAPGSLSGAGRAGARVVKNMRMAGRMGGDRITVKNLRILQIHPESNTVLVSGALPGRPGTTIEIRG